MDPAQIQTSGFGDVAPFLMHIILDPRITQREPFGHIVYKLMPWFV